MVTNFSFTKKGLSVSFRDLSTGVPDGSIYHWDFGDLKGSEEKNPTHEYTDSGFYNVTLEIISPPDEEGESIKAKKELRLGVSDLAKTQLSDSIYNLINSYIPESLLPYLSDVDKQVYIEKWQLYLQPLVCRPNGEEIPYYEYNNELAYEALENQLIMELAAYDFLTVGILNMMRSVSDMIENESSSTEGSTEGTDPNNPNQRVKAITTGPTEVQFYEGLSGDTASSLAKTITGALQPGGLVDTLKANLCMLAGRLCIYLPICDMPRRVTVPRVVNRRVPGPLGGPNPTAPLRSGKGYESFNDPNNVPSQG